MSLASQVSALATKLGQDYKSLTASVSAKQDKLTFDVNPTKGSGNVVSSGSVWTSSYARRYASSADNVGASSFTTAQWSGGDYVFKAGTNWVFTTGSVWQNSFGTRVGLTLKWNAAAPTNTAAALTAIKGCVTWQFNTVNELYFCEPIVSLTGAAAVNISSAILGTPTPVDAQNIQYAIGSVASPTATFNQGDTITVTLFARRVNQANYSGNGAGAIGLDS